jgi:hypothetical protein
MPKVRKVMSLNPKGDFLMHGVVLQNRVFRHAAVMFHVKHSCVKGPPAWAHTLAMFHVKPFSPAPLISAHPACGALFHVKHFCVNPPPEFVSPDSQSYIPIPAQTRKTAS